MALVVGFGTVRSPRANWMIPRRSKNMLSARKSKVGECAGRLGEKLKDSQLTANDVATDTESTSVEAP
jgi:hypothetical protein